MAGCLWDSAVAGGFPVLDLFRVLAALRDVVLGLESWDEAAAAVGLDFVVVVTGSC